MTKTLKQVLAAESLEDAEEDDVLEEEIEDQLVAELRSRGLQQNVSTFACEGSAPGHDGFQLPAVQADCG